MMSDFNDEFKDLSKIGKIVTCVVLALVVIFVLTILCVGIGVLLHFGIL